LHIIIPKLHLAPNEILEKVHLLREKTSGSDYDTEKDVRLLFKHIDERFRYLRKELKIS